MTRAEHEKDYQEVVRNLQNAAEILSTKANKMDNHYQDVKYVKMACGTAYSGVLLAVETCLALLGKPLNKKKGRLSVEDYRKALAQWNKKLLAAFNDAYEALHLMGYYDGTTAYHTIKGGMEAANKIADYIRPAGFTAIKTEI